MAGGKGDLSWILHNVDGINSIIADPRMPNHRSLVKSVKFLLDHPEEAKVRSVEGLPTHQPLAKLLPLLLANCGIGSGGRHEFANDATCDNYNIDLKSPKYMRMHVDHCLVKIIQQTLSETGQGADTSVWNNYWEKEQHRIDLNKVHYGGTAPKKHTSNVNSTSESSQIREAQAALEIFQSLDLIVGFHPDQATEATIDLALLLNIPFAVVPCCVFPSEFPNRTYNGKRVRKHAEFVEYLCTKHDRIKREKLSFVETETAKNVVLYMLKEDFT